MGSINKFLLGNGNFQPKLEGWLRHYVLFFFSILDHQRPREVQKVRVKGKPRYYTNDLPTIITLIISCVPYVQKDCLNELEAEHRAIIELKVTVIPL